MENFNKVLSFFLGLIVVIVFVIILSNRLNLKNKFVPFQTKKVTPTKVAPLAKNAKVPTPTSTPVRAPQKQETKKQVPTARLVIDKKTTPTPTPKIVAQTGAKKPTRIPATGSPTLLLLPIATGAFFLGRYLRKAGKTR